MLFINNKNKPQHSVFEIGDTVTVCSRKHIEKTLDVLNRHENCLFMDQMYQYCDQKFTILKVVNNLFDEKCLKMHKVSVPLYILNTVICNGDVDLFNQRCDHSCYLLWHKDWLQKE